MCHGLALSILQLFLHFRLLFHYYEYIAHYVTPEDYEAVKALGISNPEAYDFKKILEW